MQEFVYAAAVAACMATSLLSDDGAVIVNSGSTNTPGFRIVVERSGRATYTPAARHAGKPSETQEQPRTLTVSKDLARRLFADLDSGKPLSQLPRGGCMKSASFGSTLTIETAGDTTPDLSCGDHGDSRLKALIQDAADIQQAFNGK